jgi:hypothetical protein
VRCPSGGSVDQRLEVRQDAVVEGGLQHNAEFRLAGPFVSERQKTDHGAAGWSLADSSEQGVERKGVGAAGKQLVAIDQIEQRHRLAAQGMNDMAIVDDMAMLAVWLRSPAPQGDDVRGALEAFESVVIKTYAQPMTNQSGWDRVKHFA